MAIRILAISDGVVPTGLARVMHSLLRRLPTDDYEIHHLAGNYRGDPHDAPWKVYPAFAGGDIYGMRRLDELTKRIDPHAILIVNDAWIITEYLAELKKTSHKARVFAWTLVESDPFDADWLCDIGTVHQLVVCTQFAKEQIQFALGGQLCNRRIEVIPFGVDQDKFYSVSDDTDSAKAQLHVLPDKGIPNSFIVLNANRNQSRKRIDITLKAFSLFAKGKPENVKLYLHMGVQDLGWSLLKLTQRFGIDERVIISNSGGPTPSVGDSDLNLIYNACDVGINTSSCEGWGLVSFEHAATKRAQVVPDVPSLRGLWEGSAILAPFNSTFIHEHTNINGYLVDEVRLAKILDDLYCDAEARKHCAEACFTNAMRAEHTWESIASRWDALFKQVG